MLTLLSRIPAGKQQGLAKGLVTLAVFVAGFGLLFVMAFGEETTTDTSGHLWWKETTTTEIPLDERRLYLIVGIGLLLMATLCVLAALRLFTMQGRFKRYVAILTGVESIGVRQIANITDLSPTRARGEIQSMIDSEMISDFYIDYQADQVVSKKYIPKVSHKTVVTCTGCGGRNELIIGITRHCSMCGESLVLT